MERIAGHEIFMFIQESPRLVKDLNTDGNDHGDQPTSVIVNSPTVRPSANRPIAMHDFL